MTDAMMYSPSVAKSEMTMLRKIELVKISLTERGFPPLFSIFWIPFTARKNAANYRFQAQREMSIERLDLVASSGEGRGLTVI
jgi:hypothetical protein